MIDEYYNNYRLRSENIYNVSGINIKQHDIGTETLMPLSVTSVI